MFPHEKRYNVIIAESEKIAACRVANRIAAIIRTQNVAGLPTVLGLATGHTPVFLYQELIRLHREEALDFSHVIAFNLDEYYPIDPRSPYSYHYFMRVNLFDHINVHPANIHIPDGMVSRKMLANYCDTYEKEIRQVGGIQYLVLGIGQNGHIAFNEPGSDQTSRTRLVRLDQSTKKNALSQFRSATDVPDEALTMGVATILAAQKIALLAFGESKARIIQQMITNPMSSTLPASYLQMHPDATIYLDHSAAGLLEDKTELIH